MTVVLLPASENSIGLHKSLLHLVAYVWGIIDDEQRSAARLLPVAMPPLHGRELATIPCAMVYDVQLHWMVVCSPQIRHGLKEEVVEDPDLFVCIFPEAVAVLTDKAEDVHFNPSHEASLEVDSELVWNEPIVRIQDLMKV